MKDFRRPILDKSAVFTHSGRITLALYRRRAAHKKRGEIGGALGRAFDKAVRRKPKGQNAGVKRLTREAPKADRKMDKKKFLLLIAFWMVPLLGSMWIDRWWATCIAGVITIAIGISLLVRKGSRNPKWIGVFMIAFGCVMEVFARPEFLFRFFGTR